MFGNETDPRLKRLQAELQSDYHDLDAGCRRHGVTAKMFRTAKFAFHIATLVFAVYLVQIAGVEPIIAMGFAALLISGPEGLETWLIKQGQIERTDDRED